MCVIIVKKSGFELPRKQYEAAYDHNPHGWGIMFNKKGTVHVLKGMDRAGFLKAVESIRGRAAVIHTRWATHGEKNVANCHPYLVKKGVYIMHNGIVQTQMHEEEFSDTYNFAKYVVGPMLKREPEIFGTEELDDRIQTLAGCGNKFVLCDGHSIQIINENAGVWIGTGIWVSNTRSLAPIQRFAPPSPSRVRTIVRDVYCDSFEKHGPVKSRREIVDREDVFDGDFERDDRSARLEQSRCTSDILSSREEMTPEKKARFMKWAREKFGPKVDPQRSLTYLPPET